MNLKVLNAVAAKLAASAPYHGTLNMTVPQHIYLAPTVTWRQTNRPLEIQIIDTGGVVDQVGRQGSIRPEDATFTLALVHTRVLDDAGRYTRMLADEASSILTHRDHLIAALDGVFLDPGDGSDLLTRPILYIGHGPVQAHEKFPRTLIKQYYFRYGFNERL